MRRIATALGLAITGLLALLLPSCTITTGFHWNDHERERLTGDEGLIVAVTHAALDRRTRGAFDRSTKDLAKVLPEQPGLVGHALRRELFGSEVWTCTVWHDAAALRSFIHGAEHSAAMAAGAEAVLAMRYHTFEMRKDELPLRWKRVLAELDTQPALAVAR